jgi:hypothetical protein
MIRSNLLDVGGENAVLKTPSRLAHGQPFYAAWATPIVHDTRAGLDLGHLTKPDIATAIAKKASLCRINT